MSYVNDDDHTHTPTPTTLSPPPPPPQGDSIPLLFVKSMGLAVPAMVAAGFPAAPTGAGMVEGRFPSAWRGRVKPGGGGGTGEDELITTTTNQRNSKHVSREPLSNFENFTVLQNFRRTKFFSPWANHGRKFAQANYSKNPPNP